MSASDFRMIRPVAVTDVILISSSVPETAVTAWDSGTSYAAGNTCGVAGANNSQVVYESLQAANLNNAPASSAAWWKELGTVYGTYSGGATYIVDDIVTVISADSHKLYESQQAGNIGHAVTDDAWWLEIGDTNRWAMFDGAVQSQTVQPDSISFVLSPGVLVNTLGALNVSGASMRVQQSVSGYDRTQSLVTHDVLSWYDWYYEDLVATGDVVFDDIPPYPASDLTVTVTALEDEPAALGACLLGKERTIGTTHWEIDAGANDYSTTTTDAFGRVRLVRRSNSKVQRFDVSIRPGFQSEVYRLLRQYMSTEMLFIGTSDYSMTFTYGYLGQWNVPISNKGKPASIEVKSLL